MKTDLHRIFKDAARYSVPIYQRAYSWERAHVNQFLDDLEYAYEHENLDHFYGFVLTMSNPDRLGAPLKFIDGQQRITTAALFIICARNFFHKHKDSSMLASRYCKTLESYLRKPGDDKTPPSHMLTLSKPNKDLFYRLVENPDIPKEDIQRHRKRNSPNRLLADAFGTFTRWFNSRYYADSDVIAEAHRLVKTLLTRFFVYTSDYTDRKLAQRIFKLVNDRGKNLERSDLAKNYLFDELEERFEGTDIDVYDSKWTRITNNVTNAGNMFKLDHFLHHYLIVSDGYSSIKIKSNIRKMNDAVEKLVERRIKSPQTIINEMVTWSKILDDVRNPTHASNFETKGNTTHYLSRLKTVNVTPAYPVIMAGYYRYWKNGKTDHFEALLTLCLKYHIRMQIVGNLTESTYERVLSDMADSIGIGKSLAEIVAKLQSDNRKYLSDNVVYDVLEDIRVTNRSQALVLLEEAEYERAHRPRPASKPTIEHIVPMKPNAEWRSYIIQHNNINPDDPASSDDAVENFCRRHVDLLGNQTLLSIDENASVSNRSYDKKKLVYGNSTFNTTRQIPRQYSVWNKKSINNRQLELAKKITASLDIDNVLDLL